MSDASAEQGQNRLEYVPTHLIKKSEVALRDVDRQSEEYLQLAHSVRKNGVFKPILLREIPSPNGGPPIYGLIDGLQRFTAACDAGLHQVPAHIMHVDEGDLMETQIISNLIKVDTKHAQYAVQLRRLLSANPLLTMQELADRLSTSTSWLSQRLSLTNLDPAIQAMVDNDEINLANAYALAKLPLNEQPEYVDRAITEPTTNFTALVANRVKEIKEARKQGREAAPQEFTPIPHIRPLGELKAERETAEAASVILSKVNATTAEQGWKAALDWVVRLDEDSIEAARVKYEQKKREREEARERMKKEREEQKQREAAEKAGNLMSL